MVAVAAGVLLLALGLAQPLGRPAALLAAAASAGPTSCSSTAGSPWSRRPWWRCWPRRSCRHPGVLAAVAGRRGRGWAAGRGGGVGQGDRALPGLVMLAVVLVAAAVRRDRAAMAMGLAGVATLVVAGGAWLAAVALPNWDRFQTSPGSGRRSST